MVAPVVCDVAGSAVCVAVVPAGGAAAAVVDSTAYMSASVEKKLVTAFTSPTKDGMRLTRFFNTHAVI
jgi:hypothetical protein